MLAAPAVAVMVVELLNSSVEAAIDRVGPAGHALSRRSKDLGSAAVLVCVGVWTAATVQGTAAW